MSNNEVNPQMNADKHRLNSQYMENLLDGVEVECVSSKPLNTRNTRKSKNLKILSVFSVYSVVNPELEFAV